MPGLPERHPDITYGQTGVLLVNLGSPTKPSWGAVYRYLAEFLSDRRVIELTPILWQPLLRGIILPLRAGKTAHAYRSIWGDDTLSPLCRITQAQAHALQKRFAKIHITWAMRYGTPSIASALDDLRTKGCERICVLALYPQYSATTSGSVYDKVFDELKRMRWQPALRTAAPWHDAPDYIAALATMIQTYQADNKFQPDHVLISFHGLPQNYFLRGDPYHCQCHKTARLLRATMAWQDDFAPLTFQSRFGPTQWLKPYTDVTAMALREQGAKRLLVLAPGFVSDCLETLEELQIQLRDDFVAAGGEELRVLPCLNDTASGLDVLATQLTRNLAGWL